MASESDATMNADSAPDEESDFFFNPEFDIRRARYKPMDVRITSAADTAAGIADMSADGDDCKLVVDVDVCVLRPLSWR